MNIVITGGAGFIGVNLAARLLKNGDDVTIFDNLSRKGTPLNLKQIRKEYPQVKFIKGDLRDFKKISKAIKGADVVYHLAGQVAVTTSVVEPREDFEINLLGTFNVLEAIRAEKKRPILIYSSTNKVYGDLASLEVVEGKERYTFKKNPNGVTEETPLDFHSPYGCSKGGADQYVRDYARIYDMPTVVFRQSCIYGPNQFGVEDQGWVAWFAIATKLGKEITIYGNGKQTRDILFVDDLCDAYIKATKNIKKTAGQIYNIGGGAENTISVWFEFGKILEKTMNVKLDPKWSDWRPGDQPLFVCDTSKAERDFGWKPKTSKEKGIKIMVEWIDKNIKYIEKVFNSK